MEVLIIINSFYWLDVDWDNLEKSPAEKYQQFIRWAENARGENPTAFDQITEWILNDDEWTADKLARNEQIIMQDIIARFKAQTKRSFLCQF